jgi:hypothetical protein
MVDQHASHHTCGEAVEVFAVLKPETALADEFEKQLIDDACRLKNVFRTLAAEERTGDLAQMGVHQFEEGFRGSGIPVIPLTQ